MNRDALSPPALASRIAGPAEAPEQEFWRLCDEGRRPDLADFVRTRQVQSAESLQIGRASCRERVLTDV